MKDIFDNNLEYKCELETSEGSCNAFTFCSWDSIHGKCSFDGYENREDFRDAYLEQKSGQFDRENYCNKKVKNIEKVVSFRRPVFYEYY